MQNENFISRRMIVGLTLIVAAFAACTYKRDDVELFPPIIAPTFKELTVKFSGPGISLNKVDSAVVVVRDENQYVKKWQTMLKSSNGLTIDLSTLSDGSYSAGIMIYTKKGTDNTARQYEITKSISLPFQQQKIVDAPNGTFNDTWFKRAVFFGDQNEAVVIVAMDPRDAFYEVRFKEAKWVRTDVRRASININYVVASKTHKKVLDGQVLGFAEYTALTPYIDAMRGKDWTTGFIDILLTDETGRDVYFDYEYNK
jgi:hypothetical protein